MVDPNALRWNGAPGRNEVSYVTLTDRSTGVGVWIGYTVPGLELLRT